MGSRGDSYVNAPAESFRARLDRGLLPAASAISIQARVSRRTLPAHLSARSLAVRLVAPRMHEAKGGKGPEAAQRSSAAERATGVGLT